MADRRTVWCLMIDMKMKFEGFEGLDKKLQALPQKIQNKVLQAAVTQSLTETRRAIANNAPVGPDKTGFLRVHRTEKAAADWERIKSYGHLKKNIRVKKLRNVQRGQKGARIDTGNAFWAMFYEFGTRHQPARPFFAPVFRAAQDKILGTLAVKLGQGIEKIAKES